MNENWRWVATSNNLSHIWWRTKYHNYLTPSHRAFLIIFNINVAAMGQRWGGFDGRWDYMKSVSQVKLYYVTYSICLESTKWNFDLFQIRQSTFCAKKHRNISNQKLLIANKTKIEIWFESTFQTYVQNFNNCSKNFDIYRRTINENFKITILLHRKQKYQKLCKILIWIEKNNSLMLI